MYNGPKYENGLIMPKSSRKIDPANFTQAEIDRFAIEYPIYHKLWFSGSEDAFRLDGHEECEPVFFKEIIDSMVEQNNLIIYPQNSSE